MKKEEELNYLKNYIEEMTVNESEGFQAKYIQKYSSLFEYLNSLFGQQFVDFVYS